MSAARATRRQFLQALGIGALGAGTASRALGAPDRPPNIVFILADDLGWADLGCYGSAFHRSPRIDALAREGVRFTDAYAAAPVCSATRASIMTGKYPATVRLTDFIPGHWRPWEQLVVPEMNQSLPHEEITIAEALGAAGYTTAHIGKWHLGEQGSQPSDHGFDFEFQDGRSQNDKYVGVLTDQAIGFIEGNSDRPFLCMLSHHAVHTPLEADPALTEKHRARATPGAGQSNPEYAAMIETLDAGVGRILDRLDGLGLAGNTLLVFMSDNGGLRQEHTGEGPIVTSNAPLRAEKGTLYEGGIRVPMIVRWPGHTRPNSESSVPVTTADLLPTFCEATGHSWGYPIDGRSLIPLLEHRGEPRRDAIYFHYPHYHHAPPAGAIRKGDWKLIEWFENGAIELYNLRHDIGETENLAPIMPGHARALRGELAAWRESVGAQMCTQNPDFDPSRRHEWRPRNQS